MPTLPSDRTIAFAAAIISSKPPTLTVQEYISLLTRHIAPGRRENALSAAYRHLDRSAFWRAESERAKEDFRAAERGRLEAVREVEALRAKLEGAKAVVVGGKRKRGEGDVAAYERGGKRERREGMERREVFLGGVVVEEVDFEEGDGGCDALIRGLYQIGLCFKPGVHVEANTLVRHLVSSVKEVASVVLAVLDQHDHSSPDKLTTTMTASGRVFAGIMAGLQKLNRMDNGSSLAGQVIYAIVHSYEQLLGAFDTLSEHEAKLESSNKPTPNSQTPPTKPKTKTKAGPPRINIKDLPALNALTSLLSGMAKLLDAKTPSHPSIFEGTSFVLLQKLGKTIYTLAFAHPRPASLSEEISVDVSPENAISQPPNLTLRQAQLQAPYLLHLLKQILSLTPSFTTSTSKPTKTAKPKPGTVTKTSLTLPAKERLQHTLVNAIFGTEGVEEEESDLLLDCLRMPGMAVGALTVPRVKEVEVGEWFQGEVWRLLGWEVLGREVGGFGRGW